VIAVIAVNMFVVGLAVIIHYEFLHRITLLLPKLRIRHRFRIVLGVFLALTAHAVEIWVFAIAFYLMNHAEGWGHMEGNFDGSLLSSAYFSFTTFTTLGIGDIEPHGDLRFLIGLEALTGFVLITWTASFLYLEMTRYWDEG
jgi:Ion channel